MSKVRPIPVSIGWMLLLLSANTPALWGADGVDGSADGAGGKRRSGLMVMSKASDPKVFSPIPGAQTTVLAAAYEWEYGVRTFSKEEWLKRGYEWSEFLTNAASMADRLVGEIQPVFQRDRRGVIDFAVVTHEDPFLSSIILSPKLLKRFEEQLGKRLHLLVLDRNRIFIFPAAGGRISGFASSLIDQYYDTRHPVSLELFQIDESGYRVIGALER